MFDFLKKKTKDKDAAAKDGQKEELFTELKSKDSAREEAKKKSTGCCGSCGGQ